MKIENNSEVTLHFTIKLKDGSVADSTHSSGKPAKFTMGDGSLSDNFEKCLLGLESEQSKSIELNAEDAFGLPNPDNIHHMDEAILQAVHQISECFRINIFADNVRVLHLLKKSHE